MLYYLLCLHWPRTEIRAWEELRTGGAHEGGARGARTGATPKPSAPLHQEAHQEGTSPAPLWPPF